MLDTAAWGYWFPPMKRGDPKKRRSKAPKPPPKPKKRAAPPSAQKKKKLWDYLAAIAGGARHSEAAIETGLPFREVQREYSRNLEYRAAYKKAEEERENLWMAQRYDETHHRATVGVPRSVTCKNGICGTDMVPSDRLMEVLLRKDHPEWFEQRVTAQHTGGSLIVRLLDHIESGGQTPLPTDDELA